MATFELTAPDGGKYQVDAPDEHAAVAALGQMLTPRQAQAAAASDPREGLLKRTDDIIRAIANGATFGLADRFAAGMGALTGVGGKSGDYGGNLANEQRKTDQFETQHPWEAGAAGLVGGVALPLGAAGAASKGVELGAKMGYGAAAGAGIGGVQGALSSKDYTDLPQVAK